MSIAVITACWKRPALFDAFVRHTLTLKPTELFCAGSPEDQCSKVAESHGIVYEKVPNVLSDKWNHAVQMARNSTATHFLLMGSDDFMDRKMWAYYEAYSGPHLSLRDLYFMGALSKRVFYWPGYVGKRAGEPIGAAKLVRRDVMEKLDWTPFLPARPKALDYDMHQAMQRIGVGVDVVTMEQTGGICIDVKGDGSMTTMATIQRQPGTTMVPSNWLQNNCPELFLATAQL